MYQWVKGRVKNFEAKKDNGKVNGRLQKLISEIKSKRDSLAAVQTGFPSSVASFVANSNLGWMPNNGDAPAKKKRWHSMKKASKKAEAEKARGHLAKVHVPPPNPQYVGQFSALTESVGEISEQICIDPQFAGSSGDNPQSVDQFAKYPQSLVQLGKDPQSLGQSGDDPQSSGQLDSEPQSVDVILEQNLKDQIVEQMDVVGQLAANPASENTDRLYPVSRQLFAVILVIIMSISVVLDTKKAAVGVTLIVFLVHRVVFKSQESGSTALFFPSTNFIPSILPSICRHKGYSNPIQEEPFPCDDLKLDCRNKVTNKAILPNNFSEPCTSTTKAAPESFADLSVTQRIDTSTNIAKQPPQGSKMSRSKLFKKLVFQKSASAPTSPHPINEVVPTGKALSSPAYSSSKSCSTSLIVGRELTGSESNMQKESKGKKDQALKSGHSLPFPGQTYLEECSSYRIEVECSEFSYIAISVLLIIVLIGLMMGRLPAMVLALSWCLFMKFVEIAWHYFTKQSRDSSVILKERGRSVC